MKYVEKSIIEILKDTRFSQFTGFCLNDVGSLLYSDYKNGFNRQESAEMISEQLPSLTANMKLMTDTGNFRVIKNVSFISHLPTSASQSRSAYVSVPFLQLVLHGIVGYSGEPLNFSENAKTSFLRAPLMSGRIRTPMQTKRISPTRTARIQSESITKTG